MTEDTKIILERLGQIDSKIDRLDSRMETLESRIEALESRVGALESRMDKLESRVEALELEMNDIKYQTISVKLILENEIRRDIMIVAEGHLDLNRKLDDAVKVKNEWEMLLVRTNMLESDVRALKSKANSLSGV